MNLNGGINSNHCIASRGIGRPFIIVAVLLFLAAVLFNTRFVQLGYIFRKGPVPQPREFQTIPQLLGKWLQVTADEKLDKELQDSLGTDKYVCRYYVQVEQGGAALIEALTIDENATKAVQSEKRATIEGDFASAKSLYEKVQQINKALDGKSSGDVQKALNWVQQSHPETVLNMWLTYYTGLVDTVPHIPDRCYIADGYDPSQRDTPQWDMGEGASPRLLEVRLMHFEDQTGNNRVAKNVAYVFHVNGHYESNPLGVRKSLQDLLEKKAYFAKIELMQVGNDSTKAAQAMADFLAAAKPEIERCLPDWNKVKKGSN